MTAVAFGLPLLCFGAAGILGVRGLGICGSGRVGTAWKLVYCVACPQFLLSCARMIRFAIAFALGSFLLVSQPAVKPEISMNATLWMQTSAEYAASTMQTYRSAGYALSAALADPNWTAAYEQTGDFRALPPAVILDLDETVLDNSSFQARVSRSDFVFSEDRWDAWVNEAKANAIPGAVAFLHSAVLKGVAPVYITNRLCKSDDPEDPTVKVLKRLRIPYSPTRLLCKTSTSNKTERRKAVAASYRILLLIGDDFNDFTAAPATVSERAELVKFHEAMWGSKWFVLPNPTYGSWERAIGSDLRKKWEALRP